MSDEIRAICRVFTDAPQTPILLFVDSPERNDCVLSWQSADGHAAASRDLSTVTRGATQDEALATQRAYERLHDCKLKLLNSA